MFQSLIEFCKARWKWGQSICPGCNKKFKSHQTQGGDCSICAGEWDDLTIWTKWRHRKPVSLHKAVAHPENPEIGGY
jgi:predicted amidophosphoribosyltransferase